MRESSRRAFLSAVAGSGLALAGCSTASESDTTPTDSPDPITAVEVTGEAVVAEVAPDVDVSELSLIGPDGEAVTSTTVAAGETQATLPILEVNPGIADYEHYTPGEHELVAVVGDAEVSRRLSLEPDIQIETVEQYRDGSAPADLGRLSVRVANRGTGPTWVHDITFEGAPNFATNDPLSQNPGTLQVDDSQNAGDYTIPPNGQQTLITPDSPMLFSGQADGNCNSETEFTLILGTPLNTVRTPVETINNGERLSVVSIDRYACQDMKAEMSDTRETAQESSSEGGR